MRSRLATALLGLVVSLVVSLLAWVYFDTLALLIVLPFVPFLFRRERDRQPPERECPVCGFRTRDASYEYCPRDGERLG